MVNLERKEGGHIPPDLGGQYHRIFQSISCNHAKKDLIKELQSILSNFSTSSFFIPVDVTIENETFPIVITNNSFYNILLQSGIVKNQEEYTDKIINNILKKESILCKIKYIEILKEYSVLKNDTLKIFLTKYKNDFLNKYFINNRLKTNEVSFIQEKAIIYYLFNSRIYCRRDCVSGSIFIVPDSLFVGIHKK